MKKRPLCIAALVWAAALWLLGKVGIPYLGYGPPDFPSAGDRESALVAGTIYNIDSYENISALYLKHVVLINQTDKSTEKYPLDRIKVNIENANIREELHAGTRVAVLGTLEEIPLPGNPGQFHERAYYYARKVKWYQKGRKLQVVEEDYDRILRIREDIKKIIGKGICSSFPKEQAGILEAMLLGEKGNMEKESVLLFQILGCSHILAVSGLHLSILGGGLFKLLCKCSIPRWISALLSVLAMFFYGGITGNGASVMRAAVMFAVSMGAFLAKRTYDFLSAISLSGILLLSESPYYLYDSSFLLSFGAVLGLGIVYPVFFDKKKRKHKKEGLLGNIGRVFREGLYSSISVWYLLLPLVLYFFYELPLWGSVVSIFLMPLSELLLLSGMLGGILGILPLALPGRILGLPATGILEGFLYTGRAIQEIPGALLLTGQPELWCCVLYYTAAAVVLWSRSGKGRKVSGIVYGLAIALLLFRPPNGSLEVTFLDVGQGDCACIRTAEGSCYLIDGGSTTVSKVGKYRILPFLKASGIRNIQGIFVSHMDEDHVNGIRELLELIQAGETTLRIERLFLSKCTGTEEQSIELEKLGKSVGCEVLYIQKGSKIRDRDLQIQCLGPGKVYEDSNEGSQVLHVSQGDFDVLFTGDVEGNGEEQIQEYLQETQITWEVLKVAHHGSKNSTKEEFLNWVKPEKAVISCGKDNSYGHPHREVLERLKKQADQVLLTSNQGAIAIYVRNPDFSEQ